MEVNLGPGASLAYNPRCLKRNISKSYAAMTTADKTYALITGSPNIASFQDTMQALPGVHAGGHFTIGGDPGGVSLDSSSILFSLSRPPNTKHTLAFFMLQTKKRNVLVFSVTRSS